MSIKCKAVVFAAPKKVELQEIQLPDPEPRDVLVRTLYSGISPGTELWILLGKYWRVTFPTIPGYQKVGVIEHVGAEVTEYKPGDVVFLRSTKVPPGVTIHWAGHTELSVLNADHQAMFKPPAGLPLEQVSLLVMPAVGYHGAAEVMPIRRGESVVVIGLGLIGQFSAQTAKLRGGRVIALDLVERRLEHAAALAKARTINPAKENPADAIRNLYPNGVDAVIDTSANPDIVNSSFEWLRRGGRYCFQGYYPDKTPIDFLWPHSKELVMYNPTNVTTEGLRKVAQYLAEGKMKLAPLITHVVPVEEAPRMYDILLNRREEALGVVLDWQKR